MQIPSNKKHPIIFLDYFPRLLGHGLGGIVFLSELLGRQEPISTILYIFIFCYALIWPNLALAISYNSKTPKLYEKIFLVIDSVFAGFWIAYLGYPYWIILMSLTATTAGNISVGGIYCLLRGLGGAIVGAALTSLIFGFKFIPQTDFRTSILAIGFCFIFGVMMGFLTYYRYAQAKKVKYQLKDAINELNHINRMLRDSNTSLELNQVTDIFIESLQENVFKFHSVTVQVPDASHIYWNFQTIISKTLSSDKKDMLKNMKIKIEEKTFANKIYKGRTYLYLPVINPDQLSTSDKVISDLLGYSSIVLFPLVIKSKTVAIITFYSDSNIDLDDSGLRIIQDYINQISLVMNNSFLYEKLERKRTEIENKNKQLSDLSAHLAKYIAPQVFEKIRKGEVEMEVKAEKKKLTIFVSDIVNFTEISDKMDSDMLTKLLNVYLDSMTQIALKYGGTIDKYMGDAIFVFFGDTQTSGEEQDAYSCVCMAREMSRKITLLNREWEALNLNISLKVRMGIHSGFASVGNFGSSFRMDYTMVGSAVSLTDNLQVIANPGEILLSQTAYQLVKSYFSCKETDRKLNFLHNNIEEVLNTYSVIKQTADINE